MAVFKAPSILADEAVEQRSKHILLKVPTINRTANIIKGVKRLEREVIGDRCERWLLSDQATLEVAGQ